MSTKEGYQQAFGICSIYLKIVGLWPNKSTANHEEMLSWLLFIISLSVIIVFNNLAQTVRLIMIWGDLVQMVDNLSTANLPIAMAVIKMFIFRSHKKVGRLLSVVMDDWNAMNSNQAVENMCENARLSHKISRTCVTLGLGANFVHFMLRVAMELDILPGQPEKRMPLYNSYFPYDVKPSPVFELTWIMENLGSILANFVYSGTLCLFVSLALHLSAQIANLKLSMETLELSNGNCKKSFETQFKNKLGGIVETHGNLCSFSEEINNIFDLMFLGEILSCTIQICLQFFLLTYLLPENGEKFPIFQVSFMILYIMLIGVHMLILCYASERLREESSNFWESICNYKWYKLPSKDAKLLIIMMIRAEKPLTATAGKFFELSFTLFAQILKTSVAYLSMLLAVKERLPSIEI